jgi:hypothetical protein
LLELTAGTRIVIPDSFRLAGGTIVDSTVAFLWAVNQPYLLVLSGNAALPFAPSAFARPVAAFWNDEDRQLEVVDAGAGQVVSLTREGRVLGRWPLPLSGVGSAARTRTGWFVGVHSPDKTYRVAAVGRRGHSEVLQLADSDSYQDYSLVADSARLLVWSMRRGFAVSVVEHGAVSFVFRPDSIGAYKAVPDDTLDALRWVALRPVPLDRGYLQVLADLKSDDRRLILYDRSGREVRRSRLDVAVGPVSSRPDHQTLLMARITNDQELIFYRWHWRENTQPGRAE